MSASINKVILIGGLGKDPELRFTPSGQAVCNFSLATSETFKDKAGDKQTKTEWHNIVIWGKLAETANQYLKKGSQVYLEGKITTRSWDNKDGNKKYTTEIVANIVQFLGGGSSKGNESSGSVEENTRSESTNPAVDESLPF